MFKIHNIHNKCTGHTHGICLNCNYIAESPWSKYLNKVPFETQLEIIEMEGGPFGRVLAVPEGTPPYLGALMTNAEMYPVDTLVPVSVSKDRTDCSVEPSETKQDLSSVFISRREYNTYCKKKPSNMKRDIRSRDKNKHSWKKAHCDKKCGDSVVSDDFLIPEGRTFPKYESRIRKWCRCCQSIVKMGRHKIVCSSCRKNRCYHCGIFSEVTPICSDCEHFFRERRGIVTEEDVMALKQEWLEQSFTFVKRQPKYELCHCGFYYKSSFEKQICDTCEEEYLMDDIADRKYGRY